MSSLSINTQPSTFSSRSRHQHSRQSTSVAGRHPCRSRADFSEASSISDLPPAGPLRHAGRHPRSNALHVLDQEVELHQDLNIIETPSGGMRHCTDHTKEQLSSNMCISGEESMSEPTKGVEVSLTTFQDTTLWETCYRTCLPSHTDLYTASGASHFENFTLFGVGSVVPFNPKTYFCSWIVRLDDAQSSI